MTPPATDPEDLELRTLLRAAHPAPRLPPRFQAGVWRRLERDERQLTKPGWFEALGSAWLRPAYFGVGLAFVLLAGIWLGIRDANVRIRHNEQRRYLAAVNPLDALP